MVIKDTDQRFAYFTREKDIEYLRMSIAAADAAVESGNNPFGAVLVDIAGKVLMKQGNIEITTHDCTGHAEATLMREASKKYSKEFLWNCSLYTSCEPCCMCAGACYWGNLGRIVYGIGERDLLKLTGDNSLNPTFDSDCRDILNRGQKEIVIQGPYMEIADEVAAQHRAYWSAH